MLFGNLIGDVEKFLVNSLTDTLVRRFIGLIPDPNIQNYANYLLDEVKQFVYKISDGTSLSQAATEIWGAEKANIVNRTFATTKAIIDPKILNAAYKKLIDDLLDDMPSVIISGQLTQGSLLQKIYDLQTATETPASPIV